MDKRSFVSIIIPCLNEEAYIEKCLDSVIENDYPKDMFEISIIDGMSSDGTRSILESYIRKYSFVRILDNPKKITPVALNIGIKNAGGEIIIRMDAHSTYEKDYISKCVKYLNEYNADNVGGIWVTVPGKDSLLAKAIAFSLSHRFGVGNAHYRIGLSQEPKWVDTVPFGCFRREIFDKIGLFDENLHRNEDIELNKRLQKADGKILLVPEIVIYYYAKSDLKTFITHIFDNGKKVTCYSEMDLNLFSWRHLVPMIFVMCLSSLLLLWGGASLVNTPVFDLISKTGLFGLLLAAGSYLAVNFYYSVKIAVQKKNAGLFFLMPCIFGMLHFSYGIGSIWGYIKK